MAEIYQKILNGGYSWDNVLVQETRDRSGHVNSHTESRVHSRSAATNTLTGVKNPFWRKQVSLGQNATTHCSGTMFSWEYAWLTAGYDFYLKSSPEAVTRREWYGYQAINAPVLSSVPGSIVTEVHNRCIRKFLTACENARSSVEAGQDLGEWKQSIESLVRPLSSARRTIVDHYERLRKASRRYRAWDVPSRTKALADSYLEWTFGFKPLISDIAQGYVGLQNRFNRMSNIQPVSAQASADYSGSVVSHNEANETTLSSLRGNLKSVSNYKERMKGGYRLGLQADGRLLPLDVLQLRTLDDFKVTAWDLLPYSFLIDYFTNVGDIIHASCATRYNLAWGVQTTRQRTRDEYSYILDDVSKAFPPPIVLIDNWLQGGRASGEVVSFVRNVLTPSSLIPEFRFTIPTSAKPWVNIAALILGSSKPLVPFFTEPFKLFKGPYTD
jgi:hypothetical protein